MIEKTGYGLNELGDELSWHNAETIIQHLDLESALARDIHKEYVPWMSTLKTNMLLAEIYDAIAMLNYNFVKSRGSRATKPKPYPRPNQMEKAKRRIGGKGNTMPKEQLRQWLFRQK